MTDTKPIDVNQFLDHNLVTLEWLRDAQMWTFDEELRAWFSTSGDGPSFGSFFADLHVLRLGKEIFKLDIDPLTIGQFLAIQYGTGGKCRDVMGNVMDEQYFIQMEADRIANEARGC